MRMYNYPSDLKHKSIGCHGDNKRIYIYIIRTASFDAEVDCHGKRSNLKHQTNNGFIPLKLFMHLT